jgi:hypothetical protein
MRLSRVLGALAIFAGLCATSPAHADPISDFRFGTTLYLRSATANLEGNRTATGGIPLSKPANTLNFNVTAASIGLSLPITLHLTGTPVGGDLVRYTFNETFSPAIDIDGHGHLLTSATGNVYAKFSAVPGLQTAIGNVLIESVPGISFINATGDWGTKTIFIEGASFYGGFLPATLKSFVQSDWDPVCSDTVPVQVPLAVNLNNPAPPTGQWVFLTSAYHLGLSVPAIVVISPGKTSKVFNATVAPNFHGTVHLTAAAGGGQGTLDVEVGLHHDCDPASGGNGPPVAYNPDPGCIQCTIFQGINDWNEKLGLVGREAVLIRGSLVTSLISQFTALGVTSMSARSLSSSGYTTGLVTIGGRTQAYRANLDLEPGKLELLGAMTPISVGMFGTVVGYRTIATTGQTKAVVNVGSGIIDLVLPTSFDAYSSVALSITDKGEVLGTYVTTPGGPLHGFRYLNGRGVALPTTASSPVAINASGQIAANGTDVSGRAVATIVSATNAVTVLGVPAGYVSFQVKSMNKFGWAVGVATAAAGTLVQRAFAWIPGVGFRALSGLTRALPAVDDALFITDRNTVVVHGLTPAGVGNLYVLPL